MIRRIAACLSMLPRMALFAMGTFWVIPAPADTFSAGAGNEGLMLTCDGSALLNAACRIGMGASGKMQPVRFSTRTTQYGHLLGKSIEKVFEREQPLLQPSTSDIPLLRELALDRCHPANEAEDPSGDLLQLCIPGDTSRVVSFVRGLCDRCDFEPVILKKQARP